MKKYGLPYKGSKSKIVDKLLTAVPDAVNFYDLFAGGCAVTHAVLLSGRFANVYANDIDARGVTLFRDAVNGKYRDERRWISREDFFANKDTDGYIGLCWSFGNNGRDYLYSRKIEPYKKACHYAIVFGDFSLLRELCPEVCDACVSALDGIEDIQERRMRFGPAVVKWLKAHGTAEMVEGNPLYNSCHRRTYRGEEHLQSLQRLQSLESLQRLQSLERLERLQRLQISSKSYDEVDIKPDSVVYCDLPYKGTNKYSKAGFDHDRFYDWACRQKELVLVSEYGMPSDRFTCVWQTAHTQSLCATKTSAVTERLFVPTRQLGLYRRMMDGRPLSAVFRPVQGSFSFAVR